MMRGGEMERAGDMFERALFAMERAFHPTVRAALRRLSALSVSL
jgi:hypothetical protein